MITDTLTRRHESRTWFRQANIPLRFQGRQFTDVNLTAYSPALVAGIKAWTNAVIEGNVIGVTGKGITLTGPPGHGKTLLACVMANEILHAAPTALFGAHAGAWGITNRPVYFTRWTALLDVYKSLMTDDSDLTSPAAQIAGGVAGDYPDPAWNIQLLIIDDLGREQTSASGWNSSQLDRLLRQRFDNGMPTLLTSNIPVHAAGASDWARAYGDATADFVQESSLYLELEHASGSQRQRQ